MAGIKSPGAWDAGASEFSISGQRIALRDSSHLLLMQGGAP
jgi:hypothetical protein